MSPRVRTGLALAGSVALGGGLLYVALRGVDLGEVWRQLEGGAWGWLVPLLAVTVLSVVARAWRWAILLDTLPNRDGRPQTEPTPFRVALISELIGYLVNLAVPRLGEVVRSGNVAARRPVRFAAVVGTVFAERLLDVLMLVVALVSVSLIFGARLGRVAEAAKLNIEGLIAGLPASLDALIVGGLVAVVIAVVTLRVRARRRRGDAVQKGPGLVGQFKDGALTIVRTGRPVALVTSTLVMWGCYVLMSYLPLKILGMTATYGLGLVDAWGLMTVGAVGMSLPSPSGAGTFHYATIQTLDLLFNVDPEAATSYAVLAHAAQLLFYAVAGSIALLVQGTGLRAATAAAQEAVEEVPAEPASGRPVTSRPASPRPASRDYRTAFAFAVAAAVLAIAGLALWHTERTAGSLELDDAPLAVLDTVSVAGRVVTARVGGMVQAVAPGTAWIGTADHALAVRGVAGRQPARRGPRARLGPPPRGRARRAMARRSYAHTYRERDARCRAPLRGTSDRSAGGLDRSERPAWDARGRSVPSLRAPTRPAARHPPPPRWRSASTRTRSSASSRRTSTRSSRSTTCSTRRACATTRSGSSSGRSARPTCRPTRPSRSSASSTPTSSSTRSARSSTACGAAPSGRPAEHIPGARRTTLSQGWVRR